MKHTSNFDLIFIGMEKSRVKILKNDIKFYFKKFHYKSLMLNGDNNSR